MSDAAPRTPLWDGPTRLFHWSLVILILTAWFSAEKNMELHRLAGYAVLGLVVFPADRQTPAVVGLAALARVHAAGGEV